MPLYESIFIVRPNLTDDETAKIIEKMTGILEKSGGSLVRQENWGKKKLAYEVRRERKGTYVYLNFTSSGQVVDELERSFRFEDSVIKFMTVRVDESAAPSAPNGAREPASGGV
jgi:small subunit ribosomal protein S6